MVVTLRRMVETTPPSSESSDQTHPIHVAGRTLQLPIIALSDELAIASFVSVDAPLSFVAGAGDQLAESLAEFEPDVVVTAATLGIPIGTSVAAKLEHDRLVVLQKTNKRHLHDALVEPVQSITTGDPQVLRLDRAHLPFLENKRVIFVDDVISTGASTVAALRLIRRAGGDVVAIGAVLVEGTGWQSALGDDAANTLWLDRIPLFRPSSDGWTPQGA